MGKETTASRNQYIHNYARTLAGQLHIKSRGFTDDFNVLAIAEKLYRGYSGRIHRDHIWKLDDAAVGRLACCGTGDFARSPRPGVTVEQIVAFRHEEERVETLIRKESRDFVETLACYSIIAAMADNIWSDVEMIREEDRRTDEEFDRATADYTHHGPFGPQLRC